MPGGDPFQGQAEVIISHSPPKTPQTCSPRFLNSWT